MRLLNHFLWAVFAVFVGTAIYLHKGEHLFISNGPIPAGKPIFWMLFAGFLFYSLYCSTRESLFKTIRQISAYHWGRQIGIDLYLGLGLTLFVISLNEGSPLALVLWAVPTLLFGNLATLFYVAMNYDGLVARFLGPG